MPEKRYEEHLKRFDVMLRQPMSLIAEDGQPFEVPVQGALGLLAVGYRGLIAWRQKRMQMAKTLQSPKVE